jgi:hypothetical protein
LDVQPAETIMVQPEVVIDMNKNDYVVDDSQQLLASLLKSYKPS